MPVALVIAMLCACVRQPELHLYGTQDIDLDFVVTDLHTLDCR